MLKFELEKKVMSELVNSYFEDSINIDQYLTVGQIEQKINTLHYGYQARTRSVLEAHYPRFCRILEIQKWINIGSHFAQSKAHGAEQIGDISKSFFEFIDRSNLSNDEIDCLNQDWAYLCSKSAKFVDALTVEDLQNQSESDLIELQMTVQVILQSNETRLVVSRDRKSFFESKATLDEIILLNELQKKPLMLEQMTSFFKNEVDFTQFILNAVKYKWLKGKS